MHNRLSVPAAAGSALRRQLRNSPALREVLYHPAALAARRTTARTARRIAPLAADRLIADLKGTEPLLAEVRAERARSVAEPARPGGRRPGLRATAALSAAAVVGGLVAGAPAAAAAPAAGAIAAAAQGARSAVAVPRVYPRPQAVHAAGRAVAVPGQVSLVAAPQADASAVEVVREVLLGAGARQVSVVSQAPAAAAGSLVVYVGGGAEGADGQTDRVLRQLTAAGGAGDTAAPSTLGLPAGGYVLAAGQLPVHGGSYGAVVLAGVDADGTFHAAQTLRQLVTAVPAGQGQAAGAGRGFPGVTVRDWPSTPVRGMVEGFYGASWTPEQRLAEVDFLGRTKQNSYLYAPGDDPYRVSQWREPYPAAQQAQLRELAARAARNHVVLGYALSPGQSLCYSSGKDTDALVAKLESLWRLGFRAFQLQFQDVSYDEWHCAADRSRYGTGPKAAARAQADVVAAVLARFAAAHAGEGIAPLTLLPTEFHEEGATPYRTALAAALPRGVQVAWTGVGVVPATITAAQLRSTQAVLGRDHPLVTMDNYPVNDWSEDRLYLGPYTGREPGVAVGSAALLVNAMEQPVASRIALFTAADYAWNPSGYQAQESWRGALQDLVAGSGSAAAGALRALAGNSSSSPLDKRESGYLQPLLSAFWSAAEPTVAERSSGDLTRLRSAAAALDGAFATMEQAPAALRSVAGGALAEEAGPWLTQLARYGKAGRAAVAMLLAQRSGNGAAAWQERVRLRGLLAEIGGSQATVGSGVLGPFLDRVLKAADSWSGVSGTAARATSTMGPEPGHDAAKMTDGDPDTFFWSDAPPQQDDSVGLDLGSTRAIGQVVVEMGSSDGDPDDGDPSSSAAGSAGISGEAVDDGYLQHGVLEYSTGDGGWHRLAEVRDQRTVVATAPAGTVARYVRLRALDAQETSISVREFKVSAPGSEQPTVVQAPAAAAGFSAQAAVDGDPDTAYRAASAPAGADGRFTVELGGTRPLDRVTVLTDPSVQARAVVEARRPGGGWVRVGELRPGYSELPAHGVQADALRLSWADGSPAPVVNEIVPWYADTPVARLKLSHTTLDVVTGAKAPSTGRAVLEATRAGAATGRLGVRVPAGAKGLTVSAPATVTVPRGGRLVVPLAFSAAAGMHSGVYQVEVSFTADRHTVRQVLSVRVVPPVAGPDLALGAVATSSGDKDADHAAGNITDGDPETRWTSSGGDDAWVQLQLPQAVRLGAAVLHWQTDAALSWQNAYGIAYRVETSADGVHWHTAATVQDGQGGTETVRFDAPGSRFLRIQGVLAANRFGYSLSGVEVYAVAGAKPSAPPSSPATGSPSAPASPPTAPPSASATPSGSPPAAPPSASASPSPSAGL